MKHFKQRWLLKLAATLPIIGFSTMGHSNTVQVAQAPIGKSGAAEAARAVYGGKGKVLKVEEIKQGDKTLYRVKLLLNDGRIKFVTIDGTSGKVV